MEQAPKRTASKKNEGKLSRVSYVSPAIVYEGRLTIRAGSPGPAGVDPFDGPPSPFRPPGS